MNLKDPARIDKTRQVLMQDKKNQDKLKKDKTRQGNKETDIQNTNPKCKSKTKTKCEFKDKDNIDKGNNKDK